MNSCVLWQGHLYGFDENQLRCLDIITGVVKWSTPAYGKGSLMLADGRLLLYGERGRLGLADASPAGFRESAAGQILGGSSTYAAGVVQRAHLLPQRCGLGVPGCVREMTGAPPSWTAKPPGWHGLPPPPAVDGAGSP